MNNIVKTQRMNKKTTKLITTRDQVLKKTRNQFLKRSSESQYVSNKSIENHRNKLIMNNQLYQLRRTKKNRYYQTIKHKVDFKKD